MNGIRNRPTKKKRPGRLVLSLAAAALLAGTPIHGVQARQAGPQNIQQVLDQAEQLYQDLRLIVDRVGDPALHTRLQSLRAQWVEARGHMEGRRYQMAQRLAQRNLDELKRLAVTVRGLAQRIPYYNRMAERNREILRFLQQSLGPDAPPELTRRLTLTADIMQQAERAHADRQLLTAFRQMERAEVMLRQILRQMDRGSMTRESVELEIRETRRRLEQVQASAGLTGIAAEAFERARSLQQEAEQFLAAGDLRLALSRTLAARSALRLAAGLASGRLSADEVVEAIAHAEDLMETYRALEESRAAGIPALWQQAGRQIEKAKSDLAAGDLRGALEAAQSAAKLILTAARRAGLAGGPPPPSTAGIA